MTQAPLFTEAVTDRSLRYIFRMSREERDFLNDEAARRGIKPVTLLRECLRRGLCQMPKPSAEKTKAKEGL